MSMSISGINVHDVKGLKFEDDSGDLASWLKISVECESGSDLDGFGLFYNEVFKKKSVIIAMTAYLENKGYKVVKPNDVGVPQEEE